MRRQKQKYYVYLYTMQSYDCGSRIVKTQKYIGETWAVSEKQAANNIKCREWGVYAPHTDYCDTGGDSYYRHSYFKAYPANSVKTPNELNYCKDSDNYLEQLGLV